ncbi:WD40 repeat-like protein [Gloeopeniophorella convolvens]|nr:WD40 repeat-like protein [Gloeopeniophorella convolvens]
MSNQAIKRKTAFKKARAIAPLYTGGPVTATQNGLWLVTCVGEQAVLTDLEHGIEICRFAGDTETITALCATPSGKHLLVFTSSMALRVYEMPVSSTPIPTPVPPVRVISRAHDAPVHVCKADPTSTYLASGAADGTVKVWDIARGFPTHVLRGHGGVVSALAWSYPRTAGLETRKMRLFTASIDTRIRVWDLTQGAEQARAGKQVKPEAVLEGHVSVPRGLDITEDGRWLISGGRDQVVLVWDMAEKKHKKSVKGKDKETWPVLMNTITALERVEAVGILRGDVGEENTIESSSQHEHLRFFTAGEKGVVRIWDGRTGHVIRAFGEERDALPEDQEEQRQILDAFLVPSISSIVSIHADQNILFHSLSDGTLYRQLIGFNDEIIDAAFLGSGSPPEHVALATNSSLVRVYSTQSFDARLLAGHRDIVLSLAASSSGKLLASGAKDNSARIWGPQETESGWGCVAICEGHAESIGAVVFEREDTPRYLFTGSQDRTIKAWDISTLPGGVEEPTPVRCKSISTTRAHEKDINALDSSPGGALLASGSQDKTAKIWAVDRSHGTLKLLGVCKGHKRGVWSVRFARGTRILATGSGDRTVRLWRLDDYSCLKVFEGHANSVLRVDWLGGEKDGQGQVVSASADGLLKVWDPHTEECIATLDGHEDKVWALTISRDNKTIVSGAADSVVTFWEDCTEEQDAARESARTELVLKEQDFLNYMALQDYRRAIEVALSLGHPGRLLQLFKGLEGDSGVTGSVDVDKVLQTLAPVDLIRLLRYVRDWNTRISSAAIAQRVLHAIVKLRAADEITRAFEGIAVSEEGAGLHDILEALIPYTERHLARMERLVQESYVVDYVLREMDDGLGDEDGEATDGDNTYVRPLVEVPG